MVTGVRRTGLHAGRPAEIAIDIGPKFFFVDGPDIIGVTDHSSASPNDPGQQVPLRDPAVEQRMLTLMRELMQINAAPPEAFARIRI